jgi:hypothetical protein
MARYGVQRTDDPFVFRWHAVEDRDGRWKHVYNSACFTKRGAERKARREEAQDDAAVVVLEPRKVPSDVPV